MVDGMSVIAADLSQALLPRVAAGDEGAMRQLAQRFTPFVRSIARRMGTTSHGTDDVVQETMLRLWRSADRFDPARGNEPTFVAAVARNVTIDLARRAACRPALPTAHVPDVSLPVSEADRVATVTTVRAALASMPASERELLRLAYFEQLTQKEVAARLQLPLGTVKSRLFHAFRHLRAIIDDESQDGDHDGRHDDHR
jgi:RNA polymerase sigma-70 factor (ECF subfamily)